MHAGGTDEMQAERQQPRSRSKAGKHWSGVNHGEYFVHTWERQRTAGEVVQVSVQMVRDSVTGLFRSREAGWEWAAKTPPVDCPFQVQWAAESSRLAAWHVL